MTEPYYALLEIEYVFKSIHTPRMYRRICAEFSGGNREFVWHLDNEFHHLRTRMLGDFIYQAGGIAHAIKLMDHSYRKYLTGLDLWVGPRPLVEKPYSEMGPDEMLKALQYDMQ